MKHFCHCAHFFKKKIDEEEVKYQDIPDIPYILFYSNNIISRSSLISDVTITRDNYNKTSLYSWSHSETLTIELLKPPFCHIKSNSIQLWHSIHLWHKWPKDANQSALQHNIHVTLIWYLTWCPAPWPCASPSSARRDNPRKHDAGRTLDPTESLPDQSLHLGIEITACRYSNNM